MGSSTFLDAKQCLKTSFQVFNKINFNIGSVNNEAATQTLKFITIEYHIKKTSPFLLNLQGW